MPKRLDWTYPSAAYQLMLGLWLGLMIWMVL